MRRGRKRPFRARGQLSHGTLELLREFGVQLVGTADGADSTSLYEIDFTGPTADTGGRRKRHTPPHPGELRSGGADPHAGQGGLPERLCRHRSVSLRSTQTAIGQSLIVLEPIL